MAAPATERCIYVAGGPDDVGVVDKLQAMCSSFNVKCLRAGDKPTTPQETEQQLTLATIVVVVVSRQTKASMDTWVEMLYASQLSVPIVCALRDPAAPTGWLKQQFEMLSWVDVNDDSFDQNAKGLLSQFQPGRRGASTLRKALNVSQKSPELLHPIFRIEEESEDEGDTASTESEDDAADEPRVTVGELEAKLGDLESRMVAKDDLEAMIAAAVQAAIAGHETRLAGYETKCGALAAELKEAQDSLTLLRERLDAASSLSPSGGGGGGVAMRKPSNTKGVFPSPNPKELSARSQMAQVLNGGKGGKGGGLFGGGMPKLNKTPSPFAPALKEDDEPDRNSQLHEVFGAAD